MKKLLRSDTRSIYIDCDAHKVFKFTSNLENLPKWGSSVCKTVKKTDSGYMCESPMGEKKIRTVTDGKLGVIDQYLSLSRSDELMMPIRVIPNGSGAEVLCTMFQHSDLSDEKYEEQLSSMQMELDRLKDLMERKM